MQSRICLSPIDDWEAASPILLSSAAKVTMADFTGGEM
jgi:hypothetical protein